LKHGVIRAIQCHSDKTGYEFYGFESNTDLPPPTTPNVPFPNTELQGGPKSKPLPNYQKIILIVLKPVN